MPPCSLPMRPAVLLALCATALVAGCGGSSSGGEERPERISKRAEGRPNIIVIMTDDQAEGTLREGMPASAEALLSTGTRFTDSIVTTPLCCPSRASFITGQYAHNHRILENSPGYPVLAEPGNVLPVWMRRAGYHTALVGKYLNGYGDEDEVAEEAAPGWNDWRAMLRGYRYRGFRLGLDGEIRTYPDDAYLTEQLTNQALDVIYGHAKSRSPEPLFMWLTYWAPHPERGAEDPVCRGRAIPAARDRGLVERISLPAGKGLREQDVSDKPAFVRSRKPLDRRARERVRVEYACGIASLRSVDRGVAAIRAELRRLGLLDETILIFTSDNGFLNGEHRIKSGKGVPYEESIRVPLIISDPGRLLGRRVDTADGLVANIDLAPTILEIAGGRPCQDGRKCRPLDGRSLLGAMAGDAADDPDRAVVVESDDGKPCGYQGLRTPSYLYVEYAASEDPDCAGERELYDLRRDPDQRENLLGRASGPEPPVARRLARRLRSLRSCEGARCR